MYMEPNGADVTTNIAEAVPHMNSMVLRLCGHNSITNMTVQKGEKTIILFNYGDCQATYELTRKETRPRRMQFTINDTTWKREIGKNYSQYLFNGQQKIAIQDPLTASVYSFVHAIKGGQPLIPPEEVLANVAMLDKIVQSC